jgi:hypothetical protein
LKPAAIRRIYGVVISFLLVWPAFHWVLVTHYDTDPWKLVGFAMYTMHHRIDVRVVDVTGKPVDITDDLFPRAGMEKKRFTRVRRALGDLVEPDELARIVFAKKAEIRALRVVVIRRRLDRSSVFVEKRTPYRYERPS